MALLRLIFILIIVYMVYRLLVRYIIPFLLKAFIKKSQDRFYQQNPDLRIAWVDYVPEKEILKQALTKMIILIMKKLNKG